MLFILSFFYLSFHFFFFFFFFNDTATTEIYTLSLHDALPISISWLLVLSFVSMFGMLNDPASAFAVTQRRSEEHTSELQSRSDLVCRLLLEKKKKRIPLHLITSSIGDKSIVCESPRPLER